MLYTAQKFQDNRVLLNLLVYDRQQQDLETNYTAVKNMRDREMSLTRVMQNLEGTYHLSSPKEARSAKRPMPASVSPEILSRSLEPSQLKLKSNLGGSSSVLNQSTELPREIRGASGSPDFSRMTKSELFKHIAQ